MYLNIKQAADYINVSMDTLRRWEKTGKLVPERIGDRQDRKYAIKRLDAFLKESKLAISIDHKKLSLLIKQYSKDVALFLQELVRTPSVNGENPEKDIADLILYKAQQLSLPSFLVWKNKERPNVFIGNNFTEKSSLLLVAHLDTVTPGDVEQWSYNPFAAEIIDNKLYGRGAADCKAGIALSVYALKILQELGLLNLAKFIGGSDEETGAQSDFGLPYAIQQGLNASAAIYTYTGYNTISIGNRGLIRLVIKSHGKQVHTGLKAWSQKRGGKNAIDGLIAFANELYKIPLESVHKKFPGYVSVQTITQISGGRSESVVPDFASMLVDTRLLPNVDHAAYIQKVRQIAKTLQTTLGYRITVSVKNNAPAALISEREPIVKILKKLTKEIFSITPVVKGRGPSNESGLLNRKGIPTIGGYGISGHKAHGIDEYVELDDIPKILEAYVKTAIELHNNQAKKR